MPDRPRSPLRRSPRRSPARRSPARRQRSPRREKSPIREAKKEPAVEESTDVSHEALIGQSVVSVKAEMTTEQPDMTLKITRRVDTGERQVVDTSREFDGVGVR